MLQRLQPADHRIDTRPDLLVLVQKLRTLIGEHLMTLPQSAVFLSELIHRGGEFFDALLEALELEIELTSCCVSHAETIEPCSQAGQSRCVRVQA